MHERPDDLARLLTIAHARLRATRFLTQRMETKVTVSHNEGMSDTGDGFDAVRENYPAILTTAQVAEMLDLNVRTVLNMAGDGRLPASRLASR